MLAIKVHLWKCALLHHEDNRIHIIWSNPVYFLHATFFSPMDNLISFITMMTNARWLHQTKAIIFSVTG